MVVQHSCLCTCQTLGRLKNTKFKSSGIETSCDFAAWISTAYRIETQIIPQINTWKWRHVPRQKAVCAIYISDIWITIPQNLYQCNIICRYHFQFQMHSMPLPIPTIIYCMKLLHVDDIIGVGIMIGFYMLKIAWCPEACSDQTYQGIHQCQ